MDDERGLVWSRHPLRPGSPRVAILEGDSSAGSFPIFLPFQHEAAVEEQIEFIKGFYSNPPLDRLERHQFPYLNRATMDRFVGDATSAVETIYQEITAEISVIDVDCSLQLLPEGLLYPYNGSIGDR